MIGDDSTDIAQPGAFPVKGRVRAVLLLGFCCWHAAFMIASIVPRNDGPHERGNRAVDFYRLFVGGEQQWNMFETIPRHHSLDARIVVDDGKGGRTTLGSVMPGFTPYPSPENARYYNVFYRILQGSVRSPLFLAYLRKTEELLRARHGDSVTGHWALVVDVEWTRTLSESSRDGVLYVSGKRYFDTANPGGVAP